MKMCKQNKKSEELFLQHARRARSFIETYDQNRFIIASLAIEACDLSHGGRKDNRFTVARFARMIEVNRKTLYEWIRIKQNVIDKLPKSTNIKDVSYGVIQRVHARASDLTSQKQVKIYLNEEMNKDPNIFKWQNYITRLNAIIFNGQSPIRIMNVHEDTILEVIKKCKIIVTLFERELKFRKNNPNLNKKILFTRISKMESNAKEAKFEQAI